MSQHGLRDLYFNLMTMPLLGLLGVLVGYIFAITLIFAVILHGTGGLAGNTHGSFGDAFFFAVQTLSTTGYGDIYPVSPAANLVASVGMIVGQLNTALATGVMFARLSRPRPRVLFSNALVLREVNGVGRLMFRVANERRSAISQAQVSVVLTNDEDDGDGGIIRRLLPLRLERDFSPVFSLSWLVIHEITEDSPLWGKTPEDIAHLQAEILILVKAYDDTFSQTVLARHSYRHDEFVWNRRFAPAFFVDDEGDLVLELKKVGEMA